MGDGAEVPVPEEEDGQEGRTWSAQEWQVWALQRDAQWREWSWGQQVWRDWGWSMEKKVKDTSDPPTWAGWEHYRVWKRAVFRWDRCTDLPLDRRAGRVLARLDWSLQARLEHVAESALMEEKYLEHIFRILDSLAGEREEDTLKRALQGAMMQWKREKTESLTQFALRREQQCQVALEAGVVLPSLAKGYLLMEGRSCRPREHRT